MFRLVLWPILLSILKNIPYALEKYLLNPTSQLCHIRTLVSYWFYFFYFYFKWGDLNLPDFMRYFNLGFLEKYYIQGHKNQNIFMIKTNLIWFSMSIFCDQNCNVIYLWSTCRKTSVKWSWPCQTFCFLLKFSLNVFYFYLHHMPSVLNFTTLLCWIFWLVVW